VTQPKEDSGYQMETGGYLTDESEYFGATVIHSRVPFADPALESRSIVIHFRAVQGKTFDSTTTQGWESELREATEVKAIETLIINLPEVTRPEQIDARIWDTYQPVIAVAQILGDTDFEAEIKEKLVTTTLTHRDAQATAELDGIVVRALIQSVSTPKGLKVGIAVPFKNICSVVWENERIGVSSYQVGAILRELGFQDLIQKSHGITKVTPTAGTLVSACAELGIQDDAIDKLRKDVLKN
jgi:hypothetical protein